MTTRAGWTHDGKHFKETITTRMCVPRYMWFIDGKPVTHAVFLTEFRAAKAADAAKVGAAR